MNLKELLNLIAEWGADPDGPATCDNLCTVADELDLPEGQYSPEELREVDK